jgi:peptidoglycan hydrolase CwlO-like protein
LKNSQAALARRLVSAYTSSEQNSTLAVLLGSTSLNDLVDRIETMNATSKQDTRIVNAVTAAKQSIQRHRVQLQHAKAEQQRVVAQKAAQRQHIESQLAQRRALLSSIRGEIAQLKQAEAARELQLTHQARERLAASPLSESERSLVDERLAALWARVEAEPKGLRWRSRARLGDRSRWYEEPEEIAHAAPAPSI